MTAPMDGDAQRFLRYCGWNPMTLDDGELGWGDPLGWTTPATEEKAVSVQLDRERFRLRFFVRAVREGSSSD